MNKNLKIALIVIMALILIITIIVFLVIFFTAERKDETNVNVGTNTVVNTNTTTNQATNTSSTGANINSTVTNANTNSAPAGGSNMESFLQPIASNFAERFGSYSNHGNFENITKLEIYMSTSMKKWAEKYVAEQQANNNAGAEYYGITTKTLNVTTDSLDEDAGTAQFTVSTQRNESKAGEATTIMYKDIKIEFILESGEWKVNEATWL